MPKKEYIEREAVLDYIDKRIPKLIASADGKHIVSVEAIRDVIEKFPAADVVEVVRCKDCRLYGECFRNIRSGGNKPDDFCSFGERKENDNGKL